jgi:hypothetical protein
MNAPLRVFSIEVVEAPSIALVVATRSLLGSAELEKLGDSLPLSSQKKCSKPIFAQSSIRRMIDMEYLRSGVGPATMAALHSASQPLPG